MKSKTDWARLKARSTRITSTADHAEADIRHIVRGVVRRGLKPLVPKSSISLRVDPAATAGATTSSMKAETIRREALSLAAHERAELAEQFLSSLDVLTESEIEHLWFQEAARRAQEMDRGVTKRVPAGEVQREAQALLKSDLGRC